MNRDSQALNYNTFYDNIDQILKDLEILITLELTIWAGVLNNDDDDFQRKTINVVVYFPSQSSCEILFSQRLERNLFTAIVQYVLYISLQYRYLSNHHHLLLYSNLTR